MVASLSMLVSYKTSGRKIAVLGDMGELGSASLEGHEAAGRAAAQADVDKLVCVGELSGSIAEGARDAGLPEDRIACVPDASAAILELQGTLGRADVVLVKASHYMHLDRVVEGILE